MKKQQIQSATSLPPSPDEERRSRMIRYAVTMGIRLVCFIVAIVIPLSWWTVIPLAGAIFLPYIAVVMANNVSSTATTVERPGSIVRVTTPRDPGPDA
jgi:hypothetical protein